ncbi:hypothetical protein Nepgr_010376 [Nepenthes gracilis]|uniref:Cupin type-1 domain-containing protein n=1 Tax=Nepenthes gracilis TaxID=150966 RepID=A0AAD3XLB9_NEPGR|nr:hypothetical protein Nepgr_010376 [Nepenthes gracilis]
MGVTIPGCEEPFQSEARGERGSERLRDEHQKIRRFREGDIIATPAGVTRWTYNDGDSAVICVTLYDISNFQNQLDQNLRRFYLAGNPQAGGQGVAGRRQPGREERYNIFSGFDPEILSDAFGVSAETISKLQGAEDCRGNIVRVERSLQVLIPEFQYEEEERQEERQRGIDNGIEETLCTLRLRENINDPSKADIFNPRGGRITTVNSQKLPILDYLQLSAQRVVLYKDAIRAPHSNINAHSIVYVTKGSGRIQVVRDNGKLVFDQQVQEGQLLVIPQHYATLKKAGREGLELVAFKTNGNPMVSDLSGRVSTFRDIPAEVLMNSYCISKEEARQLKYGRHELTVFGPRRSSS